MDSESDSEDISDEEYYRVVFKVRRVKTIRNRRNHFSFWDDMDFRQRFRMSKETAFILLEEIRPHIQHKTNWNNALSAEVMFLLTLRYYASGGLLITSGDFAGVSKSSACRVVKLVSHHIALLREKYIKFPSSEVGRNEMKRMFYNVAKFPKVIAALDCTHVRIQSIGGSNAEIYRNRKGFFSINVQTMCDSKLKILDIVARWPGSSHDSTIFNNSRIRARFENGEFADSIIVADGGYQCRNYVLTPLRSCNTPEEYLYNESQIRTRNCVERCYGVWKRRFPILAVGMRLKLRTIQSVIVATAVLHNVCCMENDTNPPPLDALIEQQVHFVNSAEGNERSRNLIENNSTRNALINEYFRNMIIQNYVE